jgi:hypothetical protein
MNAASHTITLIYTFSVLLGPARVDTGEDDLGGLAVLLDPLASTNSNSSEAGPHLPPIVPDNTALPAVHLPPISPPPDAVTPVTPVTTAQPSVPPAADASPVYLGPVAAPSVLPDALPLPPAYPPPPPVVIPPMAQMALREPDQIRAAAASATSAASVLTPPLPVPVQDEYWNSSKQMRPPIVMTRVLHVALSPGEDTGRSGAPLAAAARKAAGQPYLEEIPIAQPQGLDSQPAPPPAPSPGDATGSGQPPASAWTPVGGPSLALSPGTGVGGAKEVGEDDAAAPEEGMPAEPDSFDVAPTVPVPVPAASAGEGVAPAAGVSAPSPSAGTNLCKCV